MALVHPARVVIEIFDIQGICSKEWWTSPRGPELRDRPGIERCYFFQDAVEYTKTILDVYTRSAY